MHWPNFPECIYFVKPWFDAGARASTENHKEKYAGTGDATPDVWLFKGTVYEN